MDIAEIWLCNKAGDGPATHNGYGYISYCVNRGELFIYCVEGGGVGPAPTAELQSVYFVGKILF